MTSLLASLLAGLLTLPSAPQATPTGSWPLDPRPAVVTRFDPPDSAWGAGHRGVDLSGSVGQPVRAALAGRVTHAAVLAGRGVVVVDHGATRTTYEPVAALVAVGDPVAEGEVLGRLEQAGSHCLPAACLHWGWLRGRTYLDPLDLVGAERVRLLPLHGFASAPAAAPRAGERPTADRTSVWLGLTLAGALAGRPSGAARW